MSITSIITAGAVTTMLLAGVASAQTTTDNSSPSDNTSSLTGTVTSPTDTTGTTNSAPGVPNTGAGGNDVANIIALVASGAVALGGVAYLSRKASV